MIICKVVGHVWATKKEERLNGLKLMVVQEDSPDKKKRDIFVAADTVGAGIGEQVLVVSGSTARSIFKERMDGQVPTDMAIVGIIDSLEINPSAK